MSSNFADCLFSNFLQILRMGNSEIFFQLSETAPKQAQHSLLLLLGIKEIRKAFHYNSCNIFYRNNDKPCKSSSSPSFIHLIFWNSKNSRIKYFFPGFSRGFNFVDSHTADFLRDQILRIWSKAEKSVKFNPLKWSRYQVSS